MAAPPGPLSPPQPPPAAHPLLLSPTDADSFEVVEPVAKRLVPGVAAGDRWAGEDEEDDVKVPRPGSGASGGGPRGPSWGWEAALGLGGGGGGEPRPRCPRASLGVGRAPGRCKAGKGGPGPKGLTRDPPPCCCRALGAAGGPSPSAIAARSVPCPRVGVGEGCAVVAAGSGLPQRGPVPLPGPGRSWKALQAPRCWLLQEVARHMFA